MRLTKYYQILKTNVLMIWNTGISLVELSRNQNKQGKVKLKNSHSRMKMTHIKAKL